MSDQEKGLTSAEKAKLTAWTAANPGEIALDVDATAGNQVGLARLSEALKSQAVAYLQKYHTIEDALVRFGNLTWPVVDIVGSRDMYNFKKIKKELPAPLAREYEQAFKDKERCLKKNCRSFEENSWWAIRQRLQKSYPKWGRPDFIKTQEFQAADSRVNGSTQADVRYLVDPDELIIKITDPLLMGVSFLEEFSQNPAAPSVRWGWEILIQEGSDWFRRRLVNVGLQGESLYFALDSNLYLAQQTITQSDNDPLGADPELGSFAQITVVSPQVARRLPPSVTRMPSEFEDLPTVGPEVMSKCYLVLQAKEDPVKKSHFFKGLTIPKIFQK